MITLMTKIMIIEVKCHDHTRGRVFRVIAILMSRTFSEIDLRDDLNQIPKLRSTSSLQNVQF